MKQSAQSTFIVILLAFAAHGQSSNTERAGRAPTIGTIKGQHGFDEGGCEFWLPKDTYQSGRYVFLSDWDGKALMKIDGKEVPLALVRTIAPKGAEAKRYLYKAGRIAVQVGLTVTGHCPPDHDSCEVVYYRARIFVTAPSGKASASAQGLCGS